MKIAIDNYTKEHPNDKGKIIEWNSWMPDDLWRAMCEEGEVITLLRHGKAVCKFGADPFGGLKLYPISGADFDPMELLTSIIESRDPEQRPERGKIATGCGKTLFCDPCMGAFWVGA